MVKTSRCYWIDFVVPTVPLVSYTWQTSDILCPLLLVLHRTEEENAEQNCEGCILHGLSISPDNIDGLVMLASCRMSQCRFDEAEQILMHVSEIIAAIDTTTDYLPAFDVRLFAGKMLLELDNDDSCVRIGARVEISAIDARLRLTCLTSCCWKTTRTTSCSSWWRLLTTTSRAIRWAWSLPPLSRGWWLRSLVNRRDLNISSRQQVMCLSYSQKWKKSRNW